MQGLRAAIRAKTRVAIELQVLSHISGSVAKAVPHAGRIRIIRGDSIVLSSGLLGGGGKRCSCGTLLLDGSCIDCNPPLFTPGGTPTVNAAPAVVPRRSALDDSDAEDIPVGWGEAEAIDESAYEEFDGSAGHLLELAGMTELCESVESQSRPRIDRNRFRVPEAATLISGPAGGCPPHPAHAEIANKRRREFFTGL